MKIKGAGNYDILKNLRNALYAKDGIKVEDDDNDVDEMNGHQKNVLYSQPTIIYNTISDNNNNNNVQVKNEVNKIKKPILSRNETVEK